VQLTACLKLECTLRLGAAWPTVRGLAFKHVLSNVFRLVGVSLYSLSIARDNKEIQSFNVLLMVHVSLSTTALCHKSRRTVTLEFSIHRARRAVAL